MTTLLQIKIRMALSIADLFICSFIYLLLLHKAGLTNIKDLIKNKQTKNLYTKIAEDHYPEDETETYRRHCCDSKTTGGEESGEELLHWKPTWWLDMLTRSNTSDTSCPLHGTRKSVDNVA